MQVDTIESVSRLTKDLRAAAATLTPDEVRFLVDSYYQMQEDRIRSGNQVRALTEAGEPHSVVTWLADNAGLLERNIKSALGVYADGHPVGRWAQRVPGIGPILSAGLLAHIDIEKAPTVGHIWRFAGLDPTVTWDKGSKRPWNARLKVLCWRIGESFVKVQAHEEDVYGTVYVTRKLLEQTRNDAGAFADQAAASLAAKRWRDDTQAKRWYGEGKLPPARIHARAKRYAVKLFLAHWHEVAYRTRYGTAPPKPYILAHGGHVHYLAPPFWPE